MFTEHAIIQLSHCNSFDDMVHVDEIYVYPIFKWITLTWREWLSLTNSLFVRYQGPYKPCDDNLYIGIIISPSIYNIQCTDHN